MPRIYNVRRYRFEGAEYDTLQQVHDAIENEIGTMLDSVSGAIGPRERLALLSMLKANRARLVELLTVSFDNEETEGMHASNYNIMDYFRTPTACHAAKAGRDARKQAR